MPWVVKMFEVDNFPSMWDPSEIMKGSTSFTLHSIQQQQIFNNLWYYP